MGVDSLVSTEWLGGRLGRPEVKVVDASWYLPTEKRDPRAEYREVHIPGAVFFDIDAIADTANPLPHMFPDSAQFAAAVGGLGIGNADHVVCYDGGMAAAACRAWWMFRAFGHERVSVLDGGFRCWRAEGRPVESGAPSPGPVAYKAAEKPDLVRSLAEVLEIVDNRSEQILDARGRGRFAGSEPEPRAGLRAGHMPGARNLPYVELLDEQGRFLPREALAARLSAAGVDLRRPVVASCGSGVSATVLLMGLHLIGHAGGTLYDGSWSEWGSRQDTPVATGSG